VLLLHAAAAAFWLGALWPLRAALAPHPQAPDIAASLPALRRFSRLALGAVAALLAAGLALAALRLGAPPALFGTDYGGVLLAKSAGVAALLGLAAWHRQRLTPALAAGQPGAAARLRRSIGAELLVGAGVLGLTAVLARTPPPAAGQPPATEADIAVATAIAGRPVLVVVAPGRVGRNRITAFIGGAPVAEASIAFELPEAGIGPLRRPLAPLGDGRFTLAGPELAIPGRWRLRLELLVGAFDQAAGTIVVAVPAP